MKLKIITGFRDNQFYIIDADEAHKAYYLFQNPEARSIFKNGTALIGKNIQGIEPAWNETMGWNPTHKMDDDDWNQIHKLGIVSKMRELQQKARDLAIEAQNNPKILENKLLLA